MFNYRLSWKLHIWVHLLQESVSMWWLIENLVLKVGRNTKIWPHRTNHPGSAPSRNPDQVQQSSILRHLDSTQSFKQSFKTTFVISISTSLKWRKGTRTRGRHRTHWLQQITRASPVMAVTRDTLGRWASSHLLCWRLHGWRGSYRDCFLSSDSKVLFMNLIPGKPVKILSSTFLLKIEIIWPCAMPF